MNLILLLVYNLKTLVNALNDDIVSVTNHRPESSYQFSYKLKLKVSQSRFQKSGLNSMIPGYHYHAYYCEYILLTPTSWCHVIKNLWLSF